MQDYETRNHKMGKRYSLLEPIIIWYDMGGIQLGLQNCQNCGEKFRYRAILRNFISMEDKNLKCENCGAEHKLKKSSFRLLSSLLISPLLLRGLLMFLKFPYNRVLMFGIIIAYIIAIILLSSYIIKYDRVEC